MEVKILSRAAFVDVNHVYYASLQETFPLAAVAPNAIDTHTACSIRNNDALLTHHTLLSTRTQRTLYIPSTPMTSHPRPPIADPRADGVSSRSRAHSTLR